MNIELQGAPEDVQYFGWALEHLPEGKMLSGLLAVPGTLPSEVAIARVRDVYAPYVFGERSVRYGEPPVSALRSQQWALYRAEFTPALGRAPFYTDIVDPSGAEIETASDQLYDADSHLPGPIDDLAYLAMLASFLGAFDGASYAIRLLATLLLRGSLNRQLTIGHFFRLLTRGELGTFESVLPTKSEAVALAQALVRGETRIEGQLAEVIRHYGDFISSSPGSGFSPPGAPGVG